MLFSAFSATPQAGGVTVAWKLQSDEAMESYTLYRRDGETSPLVAVTSGAVTGESGSYLDRAVVYGVTYHYELAVTTSAGDVFRSPVANASTKLAGTATFQSAEVSAPLGPEPFSSSPNPSSR